MNHQIAPCVGALTAITRYPIKGFPGETLVKAQLTENKGLPHDRRWAIRNGSVPDNQKKEWEPCAAFVRMTQHEELPTYAVENKDNQYYLIHPNGDKLKLEDNQNPVQRLSQWFKHDEMAVSHSHESIGYWDHNDAHLSIINISSVKAMSAEAGIALDPQRFRGNLLIDTGVPWSEFSLIGKRFSLGESEIEILRPIDRCKATSVNPATGVSDINIPHFLSSQYGHFFCGVYARVVKSGDIQTNDVLHYQSTAPQALLDATKAETAPAAEHWPRAMRVVKKTKESHNVTSFYLDDPIIQLIKTVPAASYLRLHTQGKNGPLSRSYTISSYCKKDNFLRLSIKKETGEAQFSPWIHEQVHEGDSLLVSGPFADPSLQWQPYKKSKKNIVIFTAGIGITIATSVLSSLLLSLQTAGSETNIRIAHSIQYQKDAALWGEVTTAIDALQNANAWLFVTKEKNIAESEYIHSGRVTVDEVIKGLDLECVQVFLCGPQGFGEAIRQTLVDHGINDSAIHEDVFYSPVPADSVRKKPSATGSIPVRLDYGNHKTIDTVWQPCNGTLLELAESHGVNLPANCRSGACRACLQPIQGKVENILEPATPAPKNWAYLCCASPLGEVSIRLGESE